jgi:hypothetical protein
MILFTTPVFFSRRRTWWGFMYLFARETNVSDCLLTAPFGTVGQVWIAALRSHHFAVLLAASYSSTRVASRCPLRSPLLAAAMSFSTRPASGTSPARNSALAAAARPSDLHHGRDQAQGRQRCLEGLKLSEGAAQRDCAADLPAARPAATRTRSGDCSRSVVRAPISTSRVGRRRPAASSASDPEAS